ncbi:MAG: metallophosphatase domain-containing protein [Terriglobia bacterium]|jgi:predicted phosphodiesterase
MRIVLISDTHGLHRQLEVPNGDLLIHAGDFTLNSKPPSIVSDFNSWLGSLPHRYKIIIPGNHEFILEEQRNRGAITNAILLVDSGVEIEGLKIWGSPTTALYGGAFGKSRPEDRKRLWAQIPDGLDILITHTPPFAILDHGGSAERREGCPQLLEAVFRAFPRLHVFGHIHAGAGTLRTTDTLFVNASLMGEDGSLRRKPLVVDFQAR